MFDITKNEFLEKGICRYTDEFGNAAFLKRKGEQSFVAKIRFSNSNVKASPLEIDLPLKQDNEDSGGYLHIDYRNDVDTNSKDIQDGILNFTNLVQRWISMLMDISFFGCDNKILMKIDKNVTEEMVYQQKLGYLSQYEELNSFISTVFHT